MTLRLALLLVSLVIIGIIGLVCHLKYNRSNAKKRPSELAEEIDSNLELEQELNTPFFTENVVSDIPEDSESVLTSTKPVIEEDEDTLELTTSLDELLDKKKMDLQLADQLLPEYTQNELITEYMAVLPNLNSTTTKVNKVVGIMVGDIGQDIVIQAKLKDQDTFVMLDSVEKKNKIRHLKTSISLKDKKGVVDEKNLAAYQQFVEKLATQFGCEYKFSLSDDKAAQACYKLNEFIKEHDSIIILYILAQPNASFSGQALNDAVTSAGLEHGEFDFFHLDSGTQTNLGDRVYSLANMYKPGSFNLQMLDNFSTMGLCAFMVPALLQDPASGFREMCTSCKFIADQLGGVLTTSQRELLNEKNYISICNEINAQKVKLNAAGVINGSELAKTLFT